MVIMLRDFLNWYEGFAENIDKAPNAKQWAKIKERIAALKEEADKAPAPAQPGPGAGIVVSYSGPAPVVAAKPTDSKAAERKWRSAIASELMQMDPTVDAKTAKEFADQETLELEKDPAVVAKGIVAEWATPP
jgi:hypothetical protein